MGGILSTIFLRKVQNLNYHECILDKSRWKDILHSNWLVIFISFKVIKVKESPRRRLEKQDKHDFGKDSSFYKVHIRITSEI